MANNNNVYQQQHNVSIPRESILRISSNEMLSKKDLRVLLILFTQLDGWSLPKSGRGKDPENFKKIDVDSIASSLNLKKKEVKACIQTLINWDLIEVGDSETVKNGYRFMF